MKKHIITLAAALALAASGYGQIAVWTFETSLPSLANTATISGIAPESGSGFASGVHATANTDWSNPAGNGSLESFSSNEWAIGDYYQFQVSTVGFSGISLTWDQTRSSTGPANFDLSWSTDGVAFTVIQSYSVPAITWSTTTPDATGTTSFLQSFDAVSAVNNQTNLYLRLIATSAASGTSGSNRVDNVSVTAIPEPSTYALIMGVLTLGVIVLRRRAKRA